MKLRELSLSLVLALIGAGSAGCAQIAQPQAPMQAQRPAPEAVLSVMEKVADWQLAQPGQQRIGWVHATGHAGVMALSEISPSPRFHDAMVKMGDANQWKIPPRQRKRLPPLEPTMSVYDADDHCIAQIYADLYLKNREPRIIAPLLACFETILANPIPTNLVFDRVNNPSCRDQWSWCDALFMAPPAWVRLATATGRKEFLEFAVAKWWESSDYLYDREEHLFYRDSTYFDKREANGRKVFWSRGNGWVMGGLVRVLQHLPASHPSRARFEKQFREMSEKVLSLQSQDGLWRGSLLDAASYPLKETSGSGFFCYAFAWGVNNGLLERARYEPAALRAWAGLVDCVNPDGKLTHVQPQAGSPQVFGPDSTEPYGVGAFLLAGSEIHKLASRR